MFHKKCNNLLINCAFLGLLGTSFSYPFIMQTIPSVIPPYLDWYFPTLVHIFQFIIFFCLISVVFVLISSHFTTVKIGKPPVDSLTIAYKYGISDTVSTSAVKSSHEVFPSNDKVQICYERKSGPFGLAHGAVIHDHLTEETKALLNRHGYSILQTKPIAHALYISSPSIPWLSYFGVWLILVVVYPKLYKYSKTHRLSAYPVLELYRRFSVTLIAPLSQQDAFVVPEAESLMNRSTRNASLLEESSMTERSLSTSYHTTRVKLSDTDISMGGLTPRRSLSNIDNVENINLSCRLSLTPVQNSYTAKIILKRSLTPIDNNNVAKPVSIRTSTPVVNGNVHGDE